MQTGLRMDQTIPMKLSDDALLERGRILAEKIRFRETLVASKRADVKKWNAQIEEADTEIARLGRVITETYEERRQGDLKFGEQPSTEEAKSALGQLAVEACLAEEKPSPSEPHEFEGADHLGACSRCGSVIDDQVHEVPSDDDEAESADVPVRCKQHPEVDLEGEERCWKCETARMNAADEIDAAEHDHALREAEEITRG